MKSPRSPDVMHSWLGAMRALVPLVPQQVHYLISQETIFLLIFCTYSQTELCLMHLVQMLTEDLLQLALAKAQGEETAQAHSVSCSIFGAIAPLLDGKLIMQTYLHKAMALCQVRTELCLPYNCCVLHLQDVCTFKAMCFTISQIAWFLNFYSDMVTGHRC